jgi:hypothetical protein
MATGDGEKLRRTAIGNGMGAEALVLVVGFGCKVFAVDVANCHLPIAICHAVTVNILTGPKGAKWDIENLFF